MRFAIILSLVGSLLVRLSLSASNEPTGTNLLYLLVHSNNLELGGTEEHNLQIYPEIRKTGEDVDAVLFCRDEGNLRAPVRWLRENNAELPPQSRITAPGRLEISQITLDQGGTYICETVQEQSSKPAERASIKLNLENFGGSAPNCKNSGVGCSNNEPSKSDELYLRVYPERQVAREHQNISFECRDEGNLRAPIHWLREGKLPLPSGAVAENGLLAIHGVESDDAGVYICEAIDFPARISGHQVKVVLDVKNSSTPIRSYESSETEGSHEHRETYEPYSQTDTEKLEGTREFIETDQFNLKIYPEKQNVIENHDVIFDCRDEGNLRAPVRWLRGGNLPLSTRALVVNGRLKIRGVQLHDAGDYICEASGYPSSTPGQHVKFTLEVEKSDTPTQIHESSQTELHLQINTGKSVAAEKPGENYERGVNLKISPQYPLVKEHSEVTLDCYDASNQIVSVRWWRRGGVPLPSRAVVTNGRLTIHDVHLEDAGFYTCEAIDYPSSVPGRSVDVILLVENPPIDYVRIP